MNAEEHRQMVRIQRQQQHLDEAAIHRDPIPERMPGCEDASSSFSDPATATAPPDSVDYQQKRSREGETTLSQATAATEGSSAASSTATTATAEPEEAAVQSNSSSFCPSTAVKRVRIDPPARCSDAVAGEGRSKSSSSGRNEDSVMERPADDAGKNAVTPCVVDPERQAFASSMSSPQRRPFSPPGAASACNAATPSSIGRHSAMCCPGDVASLLWREARYPPAGGGTSGRDVATAATAAASPAPEAARKRSGYLGWDDYFMAVAALSALRSKDPDDATRQGACLVDSSSNKIIGVGYNGFPAGCCDDSLPWASSSSASNGDGDALPWLHTKEPFVVHAKVNAILNKSTAGNLAGARLYAPTFPCGDCAKDLIQSGISDVVYSRGGLEEGGGGGCEDEDDSSLRSPKEKAALIMLQLAGVKLRRYEPVLPEITIILADGAAGDDGDEGRSAAAATATTAKSSAIEEHRDLLLREAKYDPAESAKDGRFRKRPVGEVLTWDDYFMAMAQLTAMRSKDPNTQVGACIVNQNKRIVGLGYNGFPAGCSDDYLPWARKGLVELHTKYPYVCHAEQNAIHNKGAADVRGATIYVAMFPCNECSKRIIQAGIREVVYSRDPYKDTDGCRASRILLEMSGVKLRQYVPTRKETIRLRLAQQQSPPQDGAAASNAPSQTTPLSQQPPSSTL